MRALYALLLLLALVTLASAQDDATSAAAATTESAAATTSASRAATTDSGTTSSEDSSQSAASTTAAATTATTDNASSSTSAASSTRSSATTTLGNTASSVRSLTGLPTLAGAGIPTVIVPKLSSAPFMQKSTYPEGTVFICVGAILGFLGMCILAWRAIIAYALHRSVKKAAMAQSISDSKTMRGPGSTYGPGGAMYNAVGHGSTLSLDHLKSSHGASKSPLEKTRFMPSQSSLFFSPTADNPNRASHYSISANRSSTYLPAGYYAAGNSTLSPTANNFGNPRTRSMYSQNYLGPSPPESPGLPPSSRDGPSHVPQSPLEARHLSSSYNNAVYPRPAGSRGNDSSAGGRSSVAGTVAGGNSTSTLNLTAAPQGRTPSAYLEDLFENGTDLPGPAPDHHITRRSRRESGSRF
ncbi:hypothetical protein SLS55_009274 [Diplodia seriata]|uniref:Csi2 protein n=1 Tax=Diplodia seriata TaxID=420778 RepID=A0ABR3C281_9PEZI